MASVWLENDSKGPCAESLDVSEVVTPLKDLTVEGSHLEEINVVFRGLI